MFWRCEGLNRRRYVGSGGRYASAAGSEEPRIWEMRSGTKARSAGVELRIFQIRDSRGPAERGISSPGHNHIVSGSIPERKLNDWDIVLSVFLLDTRSLGASICAEMLAPPPKCCSRSTKRPPDQRDAGQIDKMPAGSTKRQSPDQRNAGVRLIPNVALGLFLDTPT